MARYNATHTIAQLLAATAVMLVVPYAAAQDAQPEREDDTPTQKTQDDARAAARTVTSRAVELKVSKHSRISKNKLTQRIERPRREAAKIHIQQRRKRAGAANKAPVVPPQKPREFRWRGEEIYYSLQLNGVEALRAGVRTGDVRMKKGRPYIPVSGTAQSTGFFHSVYPVDDRANTFLDPDTFRPLRSEKYFDEAGRQRSYKVDFVHSLYRARVLKEKPKVERRFVKAIPGTTHDMFTWFYDLRDNYPFKIGQKITYYIYDGWKLSKLTGTVQAKEDLYTPMGWFKTYRIEFVREVLNSRHQKNSPPLLRVRDLDEQRATIWVSRDENMIPVKIGMKTPWGVGEIVIIKYKPPIDFNTPRDR